MNELTTEPITNTESIIDSRDVEARITDLQEADEELDVIEAMELSALLELREQAEGYSDWHFGATLINDYYFEDYARELADDIFGPLNEDWPYCCIDWEKAASELQMDYTSVDFDGIEYWIR